MRNKHEKKAKPKPKSPARDPRGRKATILPLVHRQEVAKRAGITGSYLSKVLLGRQIPTIPVAMRIAKAMGVGLEVVVKWGAGRGKRESNLGPRVEAKTG